MLESCVVAGIIDVTKFEQAAASWKIVSSGDRRHVTFGFEQIILGVGRNLTNGRAFAVDDVQGLAIISQTRWLGKSRLIKRSVGNVFTA